MATSVVGGSLLDTILEEGEFIALNLGDPATFKERYSTAEIIDTAVMDIQRSYGIDICDYDDNFVLHKELYKFHASTQEEREKVLAGLPSDFKTIPRLVNALKKVEQREILKLNDEDKEAWSSDLFMNYVISMKAIATLIRESLADEEIVKMSHEERKKKTAEKADFLHRLWIGDPDAKYEAIVRNAVKMFGLDREAFERGDVDFFGEPNVKSEL